ncbi:deoxyribonuclease-2-alpha-like isoform X2 [Varroa jacobsoni]|nr:deoxyribonuclease-2-alpha-like isoform X2 [Varroa destructor]XP_022649501.1 deoxyribonuclease-2-alpha-like isoform X2 [Varroa destructor]XP_022649509.1 deoxyribonuclease-2-alpha-like isoform X2 [Varroa destructor]XP_022687764.1 deoxyribonuclease-2-alpha-like isoform X2 [Varroa jacobsoni]XP_022687765.1 deoxyribonuclease-2-alpha-like isoform X2 [Varroa jacobsoni]XP_022687766.1 deoxyribonuclease-2-alpha-like isoform X2 [Varroa jacobsoni]
MYKAPKTASTNRSMQRYELRGSEYGYFDSENPADSQAFLDGGNNIYLDRNNSLANTLRRIFRQNSSDNAELVYIVYNDQPPPGMSNSTSNGHTKGVVIFGARTGLWIVHSVPRFPDKLFTGKYSFPNSARENGQTIICTTFNIDKLNTIAAHLRKQNPTMYAASAPAALRSKYKELDLLFNKTFNPEEPFVAIDVLQAINGTAFTAFAKNGRLNKDIYSGVLAPTLETNLFVESWQNGNGGKLFPDLLDKYKVVDVKEIALRVGQKVMRWNSHEDHSKWAIGNETDWVCIGSINRMKSQFKRGGETLCLQHSVVHGLFAKAMVKHASYSIDKIRTCGRVL